MSTQDTRNVDFLDARRNRSRIAERIWFGVLAAFAAVVLIVGAITTAAARPETCSACHRTQAQALAKDPHAQVSCDFCHAGTTAWELYSERLKVVDMVGRQIVPGRSQRSVVIDSERCQMCHSTAKLSEPVTINGIKMDHRAPIRQGWQCTTCHPAVGHGTQATRQTGYNMDTCMQCHSANPKNLGSCNVCHTDGRTEVKAVANKGQSPWDITHGENWKQNHGMGNLKTCAGCHNDGFCIQCHNVPVPHQDQYVNFHGQDVLALGAEGTKGCYTCHKAYSCQNCHGVQMPHPEGFFKGHSALVKKEGKTVCMRCHDEKSCDDCHTRHTHPGLDQNFLKQLKQRPVTQ